MMMMMIMINICLLGVGCPVSTVDRALHLHTSGLWFESNSYLCLSDVSLGIGPSAIMSQVWPPMRLNKLLTHSLTHRLLDMDNIPEYGYY